MSVERDIRFELLARLCPNSTGKWKGPAYFAGLSVWALIKPIYFFFVCL
jgi:hypothetical protein